MFKILNSIFGLKASKQKIDSASEKEDLESCFLARLQSSKFIKPEAIDIVMKHLTHEINLNKTGNKLSVDEKKALGLNTRLSITKELIDILTPEGIAQTDPKSILERIFYKATFENTREKEIQRLRKIGIKTFMLQPSNSEKDCQWCQSMKDKVLPVSTDINSLIEENCKCEDWCRSYIYPIVNLETT